jgi:hypothetical protein
MGLTRIPMIVAVVVLAAAQLARAQGDPAAHVDVNAVVRRAIQHRLDESKDHLPVRYVIRQSDGKQDTTKQVIETKDGDVERLVAVDGKPLDAEADRAELARLDDLARHPEVQEQRKKGQRDFVERMNHLARQVPDAFLYKLEGTEACASGECYRVSFTPNPKYDPPDRTSRLFSGVEGNVLIDRVGDRLERLDAHFISNVDFGFGILGRVSKGGTVHAEQTDVGGKQWELTALKLNVTGRILLVKPFRRQLLQEMSGYALIAPLGYREAIELLKSGQK